MFNKFLLTLVVTIALLGSLLTLKTTAGYQVTSTGNDNIYTQVYTNHIYMPIILSPYNPLNTGLYMIYNGVREYHGDNIGVYTVGELTIRQVDKNENNLAFIHTTREYNPNPKNWDSVLYYDYYSLADYSFKSTSLQPVDYGIKWEAPFILPKNVTLFNNAVVTLNGQKFKVTGLFDAVTTFGTPYQYWQLYNTEQFVIYDKGGFWTRRINIPNDVSLRYTNGDSRLLVFRGIRETYYYKGIMLYDTMLLLEDLTDCNDFN